MNIIIGSGFSGYTTAYSLSLKGKKSIIVSPAEKYKSKNINLLEYVLKKNGQILNNSKKLSSEINKISETEIINCKFILSHTDGAQSNIWGGVLGNIEDYNNEKKFEKEIKFEKLLSILGINKNYLKEKKFIHKNIFYKKYHIYKKNISKIKKNLRYKINEKKNKYVTKILYKEKKVELYDLKNKKREFLSYDKLFISCGPIETAKLLINSFKTIKSINIKETRHFYSLISTNEKPKTRFFEIEVGGYKFSCQLYSLKNLIGFFSKKEKYLKNNNDKYFLGQCYLDTNYSGKINISKKNSKFQIVGVENKRFSQEKFKKKIKQFNNKNLNIKFNKIFFNKIGSSNHLGASIPINKKKNKFYIDNLGKLNLSKDIFICDSSALNNIDIAPITIFSMHNIMRMILNNKKI